MTRCPAHSPVSQLLERSAALGEHEMWADLSQPLARGARLPRALLPTSQPRGKSLRTVVGGLGSNDTLSLFFQSELNLSLNLSVKT